MSQIFIQASELPLNLYSRDSRKIQCLGQMSIPILLEKSRVRSKGQKPSMSQAPNPIAFLTVETDASNIGYEGTLKTSSGL